MAKPGALTDEQRTFIVQRLACYEGPEGVLEALKKAYPGVEISPQAIQGYDPTKVAGANLAAKWRTMFEAERKAFKTDIDDVPIAHKVVRLRRLEVGCRTLMAARNFLGAAQLMEQAAKEVANAYEPRSAGKVVDDPNAPREPQHPSADSVKELFRSFGPPKLVEAKTGT